MVKFIKSRVWLHSWLDPEDWKGYYFSFETPKSGNFHGFVHGKFTLLGSWEKVDEGYLITYK